MNWVKLAVPSHSEPLQWEKIGKSCKFGEIGRSEPFLAALVGKDWKSCKLGKIGCSKSFCVTLVGKDWKSCKSGKVKHSESF